MKVRTLIARIGAAAVVVSGGLLLTTTTASAHSAPQTLEFVTVEQNAVGYSTTALAATDEDFSTSGKLIGFAVLYFTTNPVSGEVRIHAAVAVDGGIIYGRLTSASSTSPIFTGKVTGGTGAFRDAAGTITATAQSATASLVTVVFTT
ncbi:MAG TPA: hypothetical protein VN840_08815 [Streptosporangiaceae bacterium]|nr:hypothetical protein [Streptosporangiaceae bacterium]